MFSRQLFKAGAGALLVPLTMDLSSALAALPGGSLDPTTIPKYVTPLLIPPVMPPDAGPGAPRHNRRSTTTYQIAVRQFEQQVLPTIFPTTTVWGYGRFLDPKIGPQANANFSFPAFTVEARTDQRVQVRWVNQLVDLEGNFLPHLLPVDQTLHWANPPKECREGTGPDCAGLSQEPYAGPVPIVTHLHGGHTDSISDGYPEAWWLPRAENIPAGFARQGSNYRSVFPAPLGSAWFEYDNSQPATTLWYHDHVLGITRLNVYTGLAGFWLIRDAQEDALHLPGPAPALGEDPNGNPLIRNKIREIPIAVQDRSFNADGSLFYPDNRAFFEGLNVPPTEPFLGISFLPFSDVPPIWNPEFFGNTLVVNGRTWPAFEVEPDLYRLRFLNGSNSRFLILKMVDDPLAARPATPTRQFTQIGSDGGLLPASVELDQLLMGPAERADVIVDFRGLPAGTEIYLINEGPDEPFGGGIVGTDFPPADPNTTGQVMKFVVVEDTALGEEFNSIPTLPGITPLGPPDRTRRLSLNELDSQQVCVTEDAQGNVVQIPGATPPDCGPQGTVFGPVAALLGILDDAGNPVPKFWAEPITENPQLGDTEVWELHNFTADAHPIHPHLVQFQVVNREDRTTGVIRGPEPWETGFKDTVIALPGEITRIKATFDKPGLYVWHCHILEHEDNEMMRAYFVGDPVDVPPTP